MSIWVSGSQYIKGEGAKTVSSLDLCDQVVEVGEWWIEQKFYSHKAGLPNESNISQDKSYKFFTELAKTK